MSSRVVRSLYRHGHARQTTHSAAASWHAALGALLATFFFSSSITFGGIAAAAYQYVTAATQGLANPENIATREVAQSTRVLDRNGRLLYEIFDPQVGRRTTVPLQDISPYVVQATIATEDSSYYDNPGIDFHGILRAAWQDIVNQKVLQGGSTITQQLVKNVLIPEEERDQTSLQRKLKEAVLSLEITRKFTKDQILEFYLNEIYYGNLSYGIEAAAESYFGKSARDLGLGEAAMLVGIPSAPALYSPLLNPDVAYQRQAQVLGLMAYRGYISQAEANAAKAEKLVYQPVTDDLKAPHFVMYVRELLEQKYGVHALYYRGLEVTTTLDPDLQNLAERAVQEQVAKTRPAINGQNAAMVAMDPRTGQVLAMVGSADYFDASIDGQLNVATADRQPGSSFKPFTYATAFMNGYSPATMLLDTPITINDGVNRPYTPQNVDKTFHGAVSVRQALSNSMNVPAIKTIQFTGVKPVLDTAHLMGITTLNDENRYGLSLTLGAGEVKLLDMVYAYGVFANQGKMEGVPSADDRPTGHRTLDPAVILRVKDAKGNVLEDFTAEHQEQQVISPQISYLITDILADNKARAPIFGATLNLPEGRPAAVKTGTTEDLRDFWTLGYTPTLVAGVWMGNSDNTPLKGGYSYSTTGPIWDRFMSEALAQAPIDTFERPPGIVTARVCVPSGLLAAAGCLSKEEVFLEGHVPTRRDYTSDLVEDTATEGQQIGENVVMISPLDAAGQGIRVPNVIGKSEAEARAAMVNARLQPARYSNYQGRSDLSDAVLQQVCVGCVLSASPVPGALVVPDTEIFFAIRKE